MNFFKYNLKTLIAKTGHINAESPHKIKNDIVVNFSVKIWLNKAIMTEHATNRVRDAAKAIVYVFICG
ncbi:MAG: hypothetical protein P8Y58_09800, partial [Novosphingobium sp.]